MLFHYRSLLHRGKVQVVQKVGGQKRKIYEKLFETTIDTSSKILKSENKICSIGNKKASEIQT